MRNHRNTFLKVWTAISLLSLLLLGLSTGCAGESLGESVSIPKSAHLQTARQLQAADALFPESLVETTSRSEGDPELPLIFIIGEDHVALDVQTQVADLLGYLHRAFGLTLIGAEGFDEPLPTVVGSDSWIVQRATARAELLDRRLGGLEYAALVYPELRVVGVSDPVAYEKHGQALKALEEKSNALVADFQKFLESDLARLRVTPDDAQRLGDSLTEALEKRDWAIFDQALAESQGSGSSIRRKMQRLVERNEALQQESEDMVSAENPLMGERDRQLVLRTLEAVRDDPIAAMVVGKFHLPGVERELRQRNVAYVTLVPTAFDRDKTDEQQAEDYALYEDLLAEKKTRFEIWLSQRRPKSPLLRESYSERFPAIATALNASYMLRQGESPERIRELSAKAHVPAGFELRNFYSIERDPRTSLSGHVVEFVFRGKVASAYFTNQKMDYGSENDGVLEEGTVDDDFHYVIFEGSGGPPSPPIHRRPYASPDPRGPPGPGGRRYKEAVDKQQQRYPEAVSIAFIAEDDRRVFRYVGQRRRYLLLTLDELKEKMERLESSTGAERVDAARVLSEILLADIEEDFPQGRKVLFQISEDDVLDSRSLPYWAAIGGHPSVERFEEITEVYSIPWDRMTRTDLPTAQDPVERMSTQSPRASFKATVVWFSQDLEEDQDLADVLAEIRATGVRVNQMPGEQDSLILIGGAETDTEASSDLPGSLRHALQEAQAVVSVNWKIGESLASETRSIQQIEVDPMQGPRVTRRVLQRLSEKSGEESLDQVFRASAERDGETFRGVFANQHELNDKTRMTRISMQQTTTRINKGV